MLQTFTETEELASDLLACQLVIKQILDVIDVLASTEIREKMATQLKRINFDKAGIDPITLRGVQKAIALIELKFTQQEPAH